MKLFVIATLVAAAAAARLDHLERGYLPPESQTSPQSSGQSSGSSSVSYAASAPSSASGGEFGSLKSAATSNQYLPPDHGPSAGSNAAVETIRPSSNGQGSSAQYQSQSASPSNQYLGPQQASSPFSSTQQPFDEETGYHYK